MAFSRTRYETYIKVIRPPLNNCSFRVTRRIYAKPPENQYFFGNLEKKRKDYFASRCFHSRLRHAERPFSYAFDLPAPETGV